MAVNSHITHGTERRLLLLVAAVALASAGACDSKPLQADAGPSAGGSSAGGSSAGGSSAGGRGGAPGDAGVCPGNETLFCLPGSGATVDYCGDFLISATCSGGQWVCPAGQGVPTRCRCPGLNTQQCVCTSDGWQCGGGGAGGNGGAGGGGGAGGRGGGAGAGGRGGAGGSSGGAGGAGGDCPSPRVYCVVGSPTSCSDVAMPANCQAGQWVCPGGSIPTGECICGGAPRPGCVCTSTGWTCSTGGAGGRGGTGGQAGQGGAGGQAGGAGAGARGGAGGTGGTGGSAVPCGNVTTLEGCDARPDCHSVFNDPHNCACAALGCCARFAWCAGGDRARCTETPTVCDALTPYCEPPYTVSYTQTCYEGCVRATECAPVP